MNPEWLVLYCVVAICITIYFVCVKKENSNVKLKSNEFAFLKGIEIIKNEAAQKNYVARIENDINLLDKKHRNSTEENEAKNKHEIAFQKLKKDHEIELKKIEKNN
jgi:hypothetical protein